MSFQCPPGTVIYRIQAGDTYYSLAGLYNTSVAAIVSANPTVDPNRLRIGQAICLPARQPEYPSCPEGNYYTIQAGDTFYAIATRYGISVDDLREANPYVDPDRLRVGQMICIPLAVAPVTCPTGTISYTIQAGDTFYSLARKFRVSLDAMLQVNPGINPDALLIGQKICIPQTI